LPKFTCPKPEKKIISTKKHALLLACGKSGTTKGICMFREKLVMQIVKKEADW
jgi:hypothetical protein